jgi:hypothetical protein
MRPVCGRKSRGSESIWEVDRYVLDAEWLSLIGQRGKPLQEYYRYHVELAEVSASMRAPFSPSSPSSPALRSFLSYIS